MIGPGRWTRPTVPLPDLELLAVTVAMEAAGESDLGQLGVAWAIVNRCRTSGRSLPDTIFQAWQFSAWNTGSATLQWLDQLDAATWWRCQRAAAAAYFELVPDPTEGARHYLNPATVKRQQGGRLPSWAAVQGDLTQLDEARVTLREGGHVWIRDVD